MHGGGGDDDSDDDDDDDPTITTATIYFVYYTPYYTKAKHDRRLHTPFHSFTKCDSRSTDVYDVN